MPLDESFTDVVRANVDTLYSSAFLDLRAGPMVLSYPDFANRYFMLPILDEWSVVVAVPGTRTTGSEPGAFAIAAPGWSSKLPKEVQLIRSPTAFVWIVGRVNLVGKSDATAAAEKLVQIKVTPLSAWGTVYTPPANVPVDPKLTLNGSG